MDISQFEKIQLQQIDWIKHADAKVPILFAINVGMLGFATSLAPTAHPYSAIFISVILANLFLIFSCVSLALTVFPRIEAHLDSKIYFGGISAQNKSEYISSMAVLRDSDYKRDVLTQIHTLSQIAMIKHRQIKCSISWSLVALPIWLMAIFLNGYYLG